MESVELPIWVVATFGLLTALGGLTGVSAFINSLSSAKKSRVEYLVKIIEAQGAQIADQMCEIKKLREELEKTKERSRKSRQENMILRSRVKLLAKIVTRIVDASDTAGCVDDLINGMHVTREERQFLIEVVEEANHSLHSHSEEDDA